MSDYDRDYYRRRAEEELAAAEVASSEVAAGAHRRLAEQYLALTREALPEPLRDKFDFRSL